MNFLQTIEPGTMPAISTTALANIERGMIEQRRVGNIFGRQNSQTTTKLMSLTMLTAAPYRALRQCAAEIERRKGALNESMYSLRKQSLEAKRHRERAASMTGTDAELELLEADAKERGIEDTKAYVQGALKDIAALQDAYDQIRLSNGIRDTWDEADFEAGEIEHHIKSIFKLAYRDLLHGGRMSAAAAEYAEQFGVHPQVVLARASEYLAHCQALLAERKAPGVDNLHEWLQACYEAHKDDVHAAIRHLGLTDLITRWSLYVEPQ